MRFISRAVKFFHQTATEEGVFLELFCYSVLIHFCATASDWSLILSLDIIVTTDLVFVLLTYYLLAFLNDCYLIIYWFCARAFR